MSIINLIIRIRFIGLSLYKRMGGGIGCLVDKSVIKVLNFIGGKKL